MSLKARLYQNNRAAADGAVLTVSSEVSGFPGSNSVDERRWKRWRTQGAFEITSANCKLYISDGSNKTITLTTATYTSGAALAAHIQTQLNASSSLWTCTYSTTTGKFTIGRSTTTRSVRLTQTTDAVWDTIGFIGVADFDPGTATAADQRRNHTSEKWHVDLGSALDVSGFFAIPVAGADFPLSSSATQTLKASNANNFTSPDESETLDAPRWGAFHVREEAIGIRYWQYEFQDRTNPAGPFFDFGLIYLGDHVGPTTRNLNLGFERRLIDPSVRQEGESGALFHRRKAKYWVYSGLVFDWLADEDRLEVERVIEEMGRTTPFFLVPDPSAAISSELAELSKYVFFDDDPTLPHLRYKFFSAGFSVREAL